MNDAIDPGPVEEFSEPAEASQDSPIDERKQNDLTFKTVLRHFFADLIELAEPNFAQSVDLTRIEFLDKETFSDFPKGTRNEADLVAKLTSLDQKERLVLVQTEIEDHFRSATDKRGFYYYLYLRAKYRLPVLLIVVYLHGGKGKSVAVREYFDKAEDFEVCRFRFVAFFAAQNQAENLLALPQPLAAGLAALAKSKWNPIEKTLRCLDAISQLDIDDARRFLLTKIVQNYIELNEEQAEIYEIELRKKDNEEIQKMVITWEETLADREARGEARGEAKGEAKGEARGLLTAMRSSILKVLKRRLDAVPTVVRQQLDAIESLERLEEILDQALVVRSAEELAL